MPWELEISTIDVGQGESALIIARDTAPGGATRTMLIDGGHPSYAPIVHQYVAGRLAALGLAQLDHIVVSHYDSDHSGGIMSLLASDNLDALCSVIATAAGAAAAAAAAAPGVDGDHQIAAAAAAAAAACGGGYDIAGGGQHSAIAVAAGQLAQVMPLPNGATAAVCAAAGAALGRHQAAVAAAANLRLIQSAQSVRTAASAAGIAAAGAAGTAAVRAAVAQPLVFLSVQGAVEHPVPTAGTYHDTNVIDIGDTDHIPDGYSAGVYGTVLMWSNYSVVAPGVARQRTSLTRAQLGNEVLWNAGPLAVPAPANAPAAFLVSCRKYTWLAPGGACPIGGTPDNADSIGLVIRFGNFCFFTAGDLPWQGEDLIATAVMGNGFTNPQGGGAFAPSARIAAFKCGHHGSSHSTSAAFLHAINPVAAFISCGFNGFGTGDKMPTQALVNRLVNANIPRFYLTNCLYHTNHIPGSLPNVSQLPVLGNRSRVCGDNSHFNSSAHRNRGTGRLYLNEAESTAPPGAARVFHVDYWEHDDLPGYVGPPPNPVVGARSENFAY